MLKTNPNNINRDSRELISVDFKCKMKKTLTTLNLTRSLRQSLKGSIELSHLHFQKLHLRLEWDDHNQSTPPGKGK
jgi:hypothetical protein